MKTFPALLCLIGFSASSYATVDSNDRVFLVARHVQSDEFFIERAPIIGCYGLPRGPQLAQFTSEYKVPSNIGCGEVFQDNINYLVCAKVVSAKESPDYSSYSQITLDISKCGEKNNPKFITTLRTAAKLNFPLKGGEVKLTLIK